jgi:hypothetical protein
MISLRQRLAFRTDKVLYILIVSSLLFSGCSRTFKAQNPLGETFPQVSARVLTGDVVVIPDYFRDKKALFLIGYVQDSQFDVDRWLLALKQLDTPITVVEVPTIQGFFPQLLSSKINQGMKNGIPEEDWNIVYTVYDGAEQIARFLGNEKPRNVRVVLIDEGGVVRWYHDRGFSPDKAMELDKLVRE